MFGVREQCLRCGSRHRHLRLGACLDYPHGWHAVRASDAPRANVAPTEGNPVTLREYLDKPGDAILSVAELRRLLGIPPKSGG